MTRSSLIGQNENDVLFLFRSQRKNAIWRDVGTAPCGFAIARGEYLDSLWGAANPHGRSRERLFVFVFTGYLDESGTHDGSPVTVMGGLLARAQQWGPFVREFEKIRARHGFQVFHTKKFKRRAGDFKGWSDQQIAALIGDLALLTSHGLTDGVAIALDNDTYECLYKGKDKPRKVRLDSRYGLCFRMCLYHFILEAMKRRLRKKWPHLHIVMEAGHPNFGDAERIFLEVKKEFDVFCDMLQTIRKADKDACGQLMMADFVAHSTYMMENRSRQTGIDRTPKDEHIPKGWTGITHLQSTPEGLANIRSFVLAKAVRGR